MFEGPTFKSLSCNYDPRPKFIHSSAMDLTVICMCKAYAAGALAYPNILSSDQKMIGTLHEFLVIIFQLSSDKYYFHLVNSEEVTTNWTKKL